MISFHLACAQADSTLMAAKRIPNKYISQVENKMSLYSHRISRKTEKTLTKLCKWETRIQNLLQKASPETAERLFGNNVLSFKKMLEEYKKGEAKVQQAEAGYNKYRDDVVTRINYLDSNANLLHKNSKTLLTKAKSAATGLENEEARSEALQKMIRERKHQLIRETMKYLGKSKYLKKINKEQYYYVETLRNYKEIFSEPKKIEEAVTKILKRIPAFQKFAAQNSQLFGLFANPASFPTLSAGASTPIVNGIATRASMQQFMQTNAPTLQNTNTSQLLKGDVSALKGEIDKLKSYATGGSQDNGGLPDFKPNSQKTRIFSQRLEYITDLQFSKSGSSIPSTAKIALGIGYKFTDNNSAGFAVSYVLGMGKGLDSIRFSHQGLGFRTYIKSKLKRGFAVQGGAEWDYNFNTVKLNNLSVQSKWKQSALLGISKSISGGKKIKSNIQLYYDFLYNSHLPVSAPFVFRYGYSLGK